MKIISRILKELDIMPRQVLCEVLVAEVTLTDQLKYGIEFTLGGSPPHRTTDTSGSTTPTTVSATTGSTSFTATGGFSFALNDIFNKVKGLVNVLAAEGRVQILASPQIMAANNQEARIQIGSDVPTLTSQSVPLVSQTTSFQTSTVQYRSTGIILSVKPQINANGLVTLDIAQEVSDVDTTSSTVAGSPNFTVRSAKTTLTTADNQSVVLGGLIREDTSRSNAGIPGLRRMPILGPLFGSEASNENED